MDRLHQAVGRLGQVVRHLDRRAVAHAPALAAAEAVRSLDPGGDERDGRLERDPRARGISVSGLQLSIDGDSLAHRAYHALPKSIRLNAIVGFSNFLLRLWEAEQPEAVLVAWDTLEVPTYRHEALPVYQSGREFEPSIIEQLALLPEVCASYGFLVAKGAGYEADDFLAASAAAWDGPVLVATSDRDAFQLVSDRVSILQPVKGVSELARIGVAEVRERYGVEPEQVPDFIALRGDSSDKIPGAPGIGPKKAADLLKQYGTLENALSEGRFSTIADDLRLYRSIATMDSAAPLPKLAPTPPDWPRASDYARELKLNAVATRLDGRR